MKSKQFESQNLVFPPGTWIQKYATTPEIVKKVPSLHGAVGTFRLPWRSTAEARPGAGGARRLRGGRAAAATIPGGHGATAGPRAPLDARSGEQLGVRSEAPGEVQRGAADVLCCAAVTVAGGWCCILCWEKMAKFAGKQSPHFQIISKFCHLCRSAMMHEQ